MSRARLPGAVVACLLLAACNSKDPVLRGGGGGASAAGAGGIAAATGGTGGAVVVASGGAGPGGSGGPGGGYGLGGGVGGGGGSGLGGGVGGGGGSGLGGGVGGGGPGLGGGSGGGGSGHGGGAGGSGGVAGAGGGIALTMLAAANAYDFYCGIKRGQMACWGSANDSYFVTVNGPALTRLPPNLVQFTMSNAPTDQAPFCGVDASGTGSCWGPTAIRSLGTGLKAVTISNYGSCKLAVNGSLSCDAPITAPPPGPRFVTISASEDTVGTLDDTGAAWYPFPTFPSARYTEVSTNDSRRVAAVRSDGAIVNFLQDGTATVTPGSFMRVAIDYYGRVCGVESGGSLACWNGGSSNTTPLTPPTGSFSQIVGGDLTFCAVRTDGTIACWGDTPITVPTGW